MCVCSFLKLCYLLEERDYVKLYFLELHLFFRFWILYNINLSFDTLAVNNFDAFIGVPHKPGCNILHSLCIKVHYMFRDGNHNVLRE